MPIQTDCRRALVALAVLPLLAAPAAALDIDWTLVGDPGNPPNDLGEDFSGCAIPWEDCGSVPSQNWLTVARNPEASDFVPGLNEWFKAAYYDPATGGYFLYPTATDTQPVCSAPTATPNHASCGFDVVGGVTDVGAYPGSPGPYGTFDQGGNVAEWIEEYRTNPAWDAARVTLRGGAWTYGPELLSWYYDPNDTADLEIDFVGFRVASLVPEPSAGGLGIAALATLAALRRR